MKYYLGYYIKETGRAWVMYRGGKRCTVLGGSLSDRYHLRPKHRPQYSIKMDIQETDEGAQTLLIDLKTGKSIGLSCIWKWTLRFQNMHRIAWLAEDGGFAPWIIQTIPGIKSPNICYACCSKHLFHLQWLTLAQLFSRLLLKYTMSHNYVITLNTL